MRSILALAGASLALQFTQKVPFPDRHDVTSEAAPSTLGSTVSTTPDGTDYDYEMTTDSSPSLGATHDEEITDLGDSFWSNVFDSDDDDDDDSDDDSDDDDDDDDGDRYDLRSDLFRHHHGHRSTHGHRTHWRPAPFLTLFDQPDTDDYDSDVPSLLFGLLSMIPRLMPPVPLPRLPMAPPSAMFTITFGGPQRDMPPPRTNTFPDMTFMLPRQQMMFVPPRQQMDFVPPEARTQMDFVLPSSDEQETPIDENPTQPPATEPPATEPPATEPPATQPPATQPPATQPPATEPPVTQPPATQPPATQPPQPPAQPRATQPPASSPAPLTPPAAVSPKRPPIEIAPPASVEFAPPPPKTAGRPDVVSYRSAP